MTPIERVWLKSEAQSTLGVDKNASQADIRNAYKALARRNHPDAGHGTTDEFQRIQDAYGKLTGSTPANTPGPTPRVVPTRARKAESKIVRTAFSDEVIASCHAGLDPTRIDCSKHVAVGAHRKGRHVIFTVPGPLVEGTNLVVVPCSDISEPKRFAPASLEVHSENVIDGKYVVPPEECADLFPGARHVRIRFAR